MTMTGRLTGFVVLLAVAGAMVGCLDGTKTSDKDIQVMRYEEVQAAMAKAETVVIDVRTAKAFNEGHIPGAMSVPLPTIRGKDSRLTGAKKIIVYAGGWTDPLSVAGAKRLIALGYDNVYEFKGGTEVWTDSGGRLISADPNATGREETNR